jgi:hypothetical protein
MEMSGIVLLPFKLGTVTDSLQFAGKRFRVEYRWISKPHQVPRVLIDELLGDEVFELSFEINLREFGMTVNKINQSMHLRLSLNRAMPQPRTKGSRYAEANQGQVK